MRTSNNPTKREKEEYLILIRHNGWIIVDTPSFSTYDEARYWAWWNYKKDWVEKSHKIHIINAKDRESWILNYEREQRIKNHHA